MPSAPTPVLGLGVDTIGGDNNSWGSTINTNWAIVDQLGAAPVASVSTSYTATVAPFPEFVIRVTTGGLTIPVNLPSPASVQGKIYLVKRLDAGAGTVSITVLGGGTIDGFSSYLLTNQYQYVRLYANASSYDVIGNN